MLSIGRKFGRENSHFYEAENVDMSIHISGYLWYMIIAGYVTPIAGYFTFFTVTYYWTQEFPVAMWKSVLMKRFPLALTLCEVCISIHISYINLHYTLMLVAMIVFATKPGNIAVSDAWMAHHVAAVLVWTVANSIVILVALNFLVVFVIVGVTSHVLQLPVCVVRPY